MTSLIASNDKAFKAAVQTPPAMVDASEGEKVVIPVMMFASKDEPKEDVSGYQAALKVLKHVETFEGQVHAFMSARGDLHNNKRKAEHERGYRLSLEFFHDHLA